MVEEYIDEELDDRGCAPAGALTLEALDRRLRVLEDGAGVCGAPAPAMAGCEDLTGIREMLEEARSGQAQTVCVVAVLMQSLQWGGSRLVMYFPDYGDGVGKEDARRFVVKARPALRGGDYLFVETFTAPLSTLLGTDDVEREVLEVPR